MPAWTRDYPPRFPAQRCAVPMELDPSDWHLLITALRWAASLFDWITRRRLPTPADRTPQRGRHRRDRRRR